jgi:hypothetical protein
MPRYRRVLPRLTRVDDDNTRADDDGRWALLLAMLSFGLGVQMLVDGVGPEWWSYVSVVIFFGGAVMSMGRYVVDSRAVKRLARAADERTEATVVADER